MPRAGIVSPEGNGRAGIIETDMLGVHTQLQVVVLAPYALIARTAGRRAAALA